MCKLRFAISLAGVLTVTAALAGSPPTEAVVNGIGNVSGVGVVSQVFQPKAAAYNSQGAFYMELNQPWVVTEMDVLGYYISGGGPVGSENVFIYADDRGTPGALLYKFPNLKGADILGNFAILIPATTLQSGNYWLSVTVNYQNDMSTTPPKGGIWTWGTTRTRYQVRPAVWKNPGNGYNSYCTTFDPLVACSQEGNGPGLEFLVRGTRAQ